MTNVYFGQISELCACTFEDQFHLRKKRTGNSIIQSSVRVDKTDKEVALYESANCGAKELIARDVRVLLCQDDYFLESTADCLFRVGWQVLEIVRTHFKKIAVANLNVAAGRVGESIPATSSNRRRKKDRASEEHCGWTCEAQQHRCSEEADNGWIHVNLWQIKVWEWRNKKGKRRALTSRSSSSLRSSHPLPSKSIAASMVQAELMTQNPVRLDQVTPFEGSDGYAIY